MTPPNQSFPINNDPSSKDRLKTAQDAYSLVSWLIEAGRERNRKDSMIEGMFDGNPPFSASRLRKHNQSWRSNFSSMEGKASISTGLTPFYDLFSMGAHFCEVVLDMENDDERDEKSRIVTEELDRVLRNYDGFDYHVFTMLYDFVSGGRGYLMWENSWDWRFRRIPRTKLYVPDGTNADLDELDLFVILRTYKANVLWNKVRDDKRASDAGWHVQAARKSASNAVPQENNQSNVNNYMLNQERLNDHDILYGARSAEVPIADIFVREFDGSWTRKMVELNKESKEFIYEKKDYSKKIERVLCPFFFEIMDGSWNGASGLGKDIFAVMQVKDRIHCAEVDNLFMRLSILLQAKTPSAMQKAGGLVQFGAVTIVPDGFEVQQSSILGDLQSAMAVNRELDGMLQANTGIYRPRMGKESGNPPTKAQFETEFAAATVLSNSAVNRFWLQLDNMYRELVRRIVAEPIGKGEGIELAKEFHKRCKDRGVTGEELSKIDSVQAHRNVGNGSLFLRQQALGNLAPFYAQMPADGQRHFLQDVVATFTNQRKVARYGLAEDKSQLPGIQDRWAHQENETMAAGGAAVWIPSDDDIKHVQIHMLAGVQSLHSVRQGGDPAKAVAFLDRLGPHIMQHLQSANSRPDKKDAVKALGAQWKQLAQATDHLKQTMQQMLEQKRDGQMKQQRAQQIQQGTDPDTQLKAAEVQAKVGMQQAKTNAALQQKAQKHAQSMALADASTAAKIERESASKSNNERSS